MSAPETNYSEWLVKAENDFLNMENNLQAAQVPWDTVCFHAQRAAEKLLKGFLVHQGQAPTRTHDLVALLARSVQFESGLNVMEEDCRRLSAYAVGSRYPDDLFEPTKEDALAMLEAARRVREQVLKRLPGCPR